MKHFLWLGIAAALVACGDDDTKSSTTTSGSGATGGGGGDCDFMAGGGYGGFGDICMDAPSDTACVTCTRMNCCTELGACETDATCACVLDCFTGGCDPFTCLTRCGQNDATNALVQCAGGMCQDPCAQ
jgi:hypothetical protein